MAIRTKEELRTLFQTGDKPSEQDFNDLLDSLLGINQTPDGQQTIWQPPNSPVYLEQGQELTLIHPIITNEIFSISVSQELPGVAGQTNISMDFAQAAEENYIQEDALYGTDFTSGVALLHGSPESDPYVKGLLSFEGNLVNSGAAGGLATAYGGAALNSTKAKYGTSSLKVASGTSAGCTLSGSSYSSTALTVEFNFYYEGLTTSYVGTQILALSSNNTRNTAMVVHVRCDTRQLSLAFPDFGANSSWSTNNIFTSDAWNNLIVQTDGTTWTMWVNGVRAVSYTAYGTHGVNYGANQIVDIGNGLFFTETRPAVYIDMVRVSTKAMYNGALTTLTDYANNFFTVYPLQSYYITTNDNSHFSFKQASKIQSITITSVVPALTSIKVVASFDGRQTWKKWDGVQWIAVTDFKAQNNTIAELQAGFSNLVRTTQEYVDLAFILMTTSKYRTPSVDQVTIIYTDNSHYEMATVGTYTSTSDFGLKRVDPTTTMIKRLNAIAGKTFITMTI